MSLSLPHRSNSWSSPVNNLGLRCRGIYTRRLAHADADDSFDEQDIVASAQSTLVPSRCFNLPDRCCYGLRCLQNAFSAVTPGKG
jgi:hypothetical protein